MTQEHKELLIKDLCSRLPYGVKVEITNTQGYHHDNVAKKGEKTIDTLKGFDSSYNCFTVYHNNPLDWDWTCNEIDIEDIKSYLFPVSSMTEEQKKEWRSLMKCDSYGILYPTIKSFDYLYKNHIDVRGLISLGLAIDATGLNIY